MTRTYYCLQHNDKATAYVIVGKVSQTFLPFSPLTPSTLQHGRPWSTTSSSSTTRSSIRNSKRPSRPSSTTPASPCGTSRRPATHSLLSPPQSPSQPTIPLVASHGYTPKVSFDTFEDPQASMFSYTLHVQSDGYTRNRSTRVFLCASSPDESGKQALDWALDSLVQDGDELIVFRGVDTEDLGGYSCHSLRIIT